MQPGDFHGQQIMASSNAGTALHDCMRRLNTSQQGKKFAAQLGGGEEQTVRIKVVAKETVTRPGDMTADRVDRLVLTPEAIRSPRVNHTEFICLEIIQHLIGRHYPVTQLEA